MEIEVKPLSPEDVRKAKAQIFPPAVIRAVNHVLAMQYQNDFGVIRVLQNTVIELAMLEMPDTEREDFFEKGWLNFESLYQDQGWKVEYDKPGSTDLYAAHWLFSKRRSGD